MSGTCPCYLDYHLGSKVCARDFLNCDRAGVNFTDCLKYKARQAGLTFLPVVEELSDVVETKQSSS